MSPDLPATSAALTSLRPAASPPPSPSPARSRRQSSSIACAKPLACGCARRRAKQELRREDEQGPCARLTRANNKEVATVLLTAPSPDSAARGSASNWHRRREDGCERGRELGRRRYGRGHGAQLRRTLPRATAPAGEWRRAGGECVWVGTTRHGAMPNRATYKAGGWAGERNASGAGATTKRAERERVG
jgi:hypothetical protein